MSIEELEGEKNTNYTVWEIAHGNSLQPLSQIPNYLKYIPDTRINNFYKVIWQSKTEI